MKKKLELFRFNDKREEWKKLSVEFDKACCFLSIEQGKKGERNSQKLIIRLDLSEVALVQSALFKGLLKNLEV